MSINAYIHIKNELIFLSYFKSNCLYALSFIYLIFMIQHFKQYIFLIFEGGLIFLSRSVSTLLGYLKQSSWKSNSVIINDVD